MTLENIKRLMDELNFPAFNGWGYSLMMKFYQRAQSEAYEKAVQVCDGIRYSGYVPPEDGRAAEYYDDGADDCAEAIRKLKEES